TQLFPSLVVFAVIVTGTFHAETVSAIPYGSLTELGNPTLSSYHNTLERCFLTYLKQKLGEKTTYWTHYASRPVPSFKEAKAAAKKLKDLGVTPAEYESLWNEEWENVKKGSIYVGEQLKRRAFVKVAAFLWYMYPTGGHWGTMGWGLKGGLKYYMKPDGQICRFWDGFTDFI
ncbi:hypothetical protein BC835DRAFT_1380783, partial [Cytidiella melzeri]